MVFLALLPGSELPKFYLFEILPLDKLVHFIEYVIFTVLLIVGFKKQFPNPINRYYPVRISILISGFAAIFLEIIQLWVPERSFEFLDMVANATGIVFGRIIYSVIYGLKIN